MIQALNFLVSQAKKRGSPKRLKLNEVFAVVLVKATGARSLG